MLKIVLVVFQATQGPMGMTLVKVLLVWCMDSDVTELEPRALQAAASPPRSGLDYTQPNSVSGLLPTISSKAEALGRRRAWEEKTSAGKWKEATHSPKEPQVITSNLSSNTGPRPDFPGWSAFAVRNKFVQKLGRG